MDQKPSRGQRFVDWVLQKSTDKGFIAKLRRADNPDTEYYAFGILCAFGVDIEKDSQRKPFGLVGAALCAALRGSQRVKDGDCGLGTALQRCEEGRDTKAENNDNPRLRRILACDNVVELCTILRPVLSLLEASNARLRYAQLLDDLLLFAKGEWGRQKVRLRWAREYYRPDLKADEDKGDGSCAG